MPHVAALWRYPIKGHGREEIERVDLREGQTLPWDRRWAVAHELAEIDNSAWAPCSNFSRGAKNGALMAITATVNEHANTVTLAHPDLAPLTFDPDYDVQKFLEWVRPLMPQNRAQSAKVIRVENRGMTDTDYPSISLLNLASNDVMTEVMGQEISALRWRANIHVSGLSPWVEFDWVGKTLRIGTAELTVQEPTRRCMATTANPNTGQRDADTLGALSDRFGHQNFGVYAVVTKSGALTLGDPVTVL